MKVLTEQPVRFATGELLPPEDLNRVSIYAQDVVADVGSRRWAKAPMLLPYVETVGTPYTQATAAEVRTYRYRCPVISVIERGFLNANMTSSVAPATWAITRTTGGTTPTGATVPWLTTRGAQLLTSAGVPSVSSDGLVSALTDTVSNINVDRVLLEADTEYQILLAGSTFSASRADVTMHVATDRWGMAAAPAFAPALFAGGSAPNATTVAANSAALQTEALKFSANAALTPIFFVRHGLLAATSANVRTFTIPRMANTRGRGTIVRIYLWAVMAGAAAAGAVTATLRDSGGATLNTITATVTGLTFQSADSGVISRSLTGSVSAATTTDDYTILLANSSATNAVKVYGIAWVSWI